MISRVGGVVVTAAISPYREAREKARKEIQNFVEVYVKCPIEVCIERDPKVHARTRTSCVFCDYVGFRERSVNANKDNGKITQTSMAPVTLIKARDIETKAMMEAG